MFVKVVKNTKANNNTCFAYLTESYRENGKVKHRVLKSFGLLHEEQIPYLKAMYAKKKPKLVYEEKEDEEDGGEE